MTKEERTEMSIATLQVRVINASYEDLAPTTLDRAIMLVEVQKRAEIIEVDETRLLRTYTGEPYFLPKVIRMLSMLKVPFHYAEEVFSRDGVIRRDDSTCGYCGKKAYGKDITWDHIIPKSQGGDNSWLNAIAACLKCNGKKANRTPEEANMPMLWEPYAPRRRYFKADKPRRKSKKDRT
jgi:hypothetical protein